MSAVFCEVVQYTIEPAAAAGAIVIVCDGLAMGGPASMFPVSCAPRTVMVIGASSAFIASAVHIALGIVHELFVV